MRSETSGTLSGLFWIALAVLLGHGLSLWGGLAFDDHLHRMALRDAGWSMGDIVQAARVGETRGMLHFWWADSPTFWQPFRPLCFLIMKVQYVLVGWKPAGMHVFCLAWHTLCAFLVSRLAVSFLGHRGWATYAGVLFALHPGHGTTCEWIAGINEVMASTFVLSGLLAYRRFSGWAVSISGPGVEHPPDRSRFTYLALSLLAYAAALGCRESSVVFPLLAFTFDLLAARSPWRRRLMAYLCMGLVTVVYLWVRAAALGGMPMPGPPYMYSPAEPGFVRYVFDKLLFYQLGVYCFVPALQLGVFEFFRSHEWLLYLLSGFAAVTLSLTFVRLLGSSRGALGLLAWPLLCVIPVLPVFAGSHHLYLPTAGGSILYGGIVMILARQGRPSPRRRWAMAFAVLVSFAYAAGTLYTSGAFYKLAGTERSAARKLIRELGSADTGDHVFVLNLTPLACFTAPALAEGVRSRALNVYALNIQREGDRAARMEREGERQMRLWIPVNAGEQGSKQDGRYFENMAERQIALLIPAAKGLPNDVAPGTVFRTRAFEARLVGYSEAAFAEWLLEFAKPIDSPDYHFCTGSP